VNIFDGPRKLSLISIKWFPFFKIVNYFSNLNFYTLFFFLKKKKNLFGFYFYFFIKAILVIGGHSQFCNSLKKNTVLSQLKV
jgi:hypothetical protein